MNSSPEKINNGFSFGGDLNSEETRKTNNNFVKENCIDSIKLDWSVYSGNKYDIYDSLSDTNSGKNGVINNKEIDMVNQRNLLKKAEDPNIGVKNIEDLKS